MPIVEAFGIFDQARRNISGLAERARFVLSHETGKVQALAVDAERIYMRYHRARDPSMDGRFLVFRRDEGAYWLDDLEPFEGEAQAAIPTETG